MNISHKNNGLPQFSLGWTNRLCFVERSMYEVGQLEDLEWLQKSISQIVEKLNNDEFKDLLEHLEWMERERKEWNLFWRFWNCLEEKQQTRVFEILPVKEKTMTHFPVTLEQVQSVHAIVSNFLKKVTIKI